MGKKIFLALAVLLAAFAVYYRAGGIKDDTELPFADDAAVKGKWRSVDFVKSPEAFTPGVKTWKGDLFLKGLTFLEDGKLFEAWLNWTNGYVVNKEDGTAAAYSVREIGGRQYLFFQWKTPEYTLFRKPPWYYVLERGAYAGDGSDVIKDNINLPFVNDPAVLGSWSSVDFVRETGDFRAGRRDWSDDLFLKELVFLPGGKCPNGWFTWTKGVVMHHGNSTASRYEIKKLDGAEYMFFEWKSGDYTIRHRKPWYYVLRKAAPLRTDNIDLPFVDDPRVVGRWTSVDFVEDPDQFNPANRVWNGELYLKELLFKSGGKSDKPWWTWTKGVVMHHSDRTASRYEIRKLGGAEYLFFEWKSGDYVFRGLKPSYYVLRKK